MKITPWQTETTGIVPPQLTQEATPPHKRPYQPDWIVQSLKYDRLNRVYWVEGTHADDGKRFFWALLTNRPLSWRYDLTNCEYSTGAHYFQTPAESR